jgi:hypothetical protein
VEKHRQSRLLSTFTIVLGLHVGIVWLVLVSPRLSMRTTSGSFELVSIAPPLPPITATKTGSQTPPEMGRPLRQRANAGSASRQPYPSSIDEDNATHPAPDWSEELKRASRDAVENKLAQKRHDYDFSHAFPIAPHDPAGIVWDYAATHRIESIPGGGVLVHLSDNCVLILFPFPFVGCAIGKRPANGDLFEHMHDQ